MNIFHDDTIQDFNRRLILTDEVDLHSDHRKPNTENFISLESINCNPDISRWIPWRVTSESSVSFSIMIIFWQQMKDFVSKWYQQFSILRLELIVPGYFWTYRRQQSIRKSWNFSLTQFARQHPISQVFWKKITVETGDFSYFWEKITT